MKGSRPLTTDEVDLVLSKLQSVRDKALFQLGISTGFRISELLSITVKDCLQFGIVRDRLTVTRRHMKGNISGRSVALNAKAKQALTDLNLGSYDPNSRLFPFTRQHAHRILKEAFRAAKVPGQVSTHSMRKTFAKKVYERLDKDLVKTQKALGHVSINSTVSYLSFDQSDIDTAILSD